MNGSVRASLRPAFVVTTCMVVCACGDPSALPPEGSGTSSPPRSSSSPSIATSSATTPTSANPTLAFPAGPHRKRKPLGADHPPATKPYPSGPPKLDRTGRAIGTGYRSLHPAFAPGMPILLAEDDTCFVLVRSPDGTAQHGGKLVHEFAGPSEQVSVACPESMDDPAWASCRDRHLYVDDGLSQCACMARSSNPPSPPLMAPCPASAGRPPP